MLLGDTGSGDKNSVSTLFLSRSLRDIRGVSSGLKDVDGGVNCHTAKEGLCFCVAGERDDEVVTLVVFDEVPGAFMFSIGGHCCELEK